MNKISTPIGLERFIDKHSDDFKRFYNTDKTPIILGCYPIEGHNVLRLELSLKNKDYIPQECYAIPYNKGLEKTLEHNISLLNTGAKMPQIIASDVDSPNTEEIYVVREGFSGPTVENYIKYPNSNLSDLLEIYSSIGENLGKIHKNGKYHGDFHLENIIVLKNNHCGIIDPFIFTANKNTNQAQLDDIGICLYELLKDNASEYDLEEEVTKGTLASQVSENFEKIVDSFFKGYQKEVGTKVAEKRKEYVINNYVPAWDFVS